MNKSLHKPRGLFITLEGGEGAGKSTILDRLDDELTALGCSVVKTREPGGCPLSEEIRPLILKKRENMAVGVRAELLLYLSARAQHVEEVILPALNEGKIVLCDRFNDSSIAYQAFGRGLDRSEVERMCLFSSRGLQPGVTLFFDVDPQIGLKRASKTVKKESGKGALDRIEEEKLTFHEKVRDGFLTLAREFPHRVHCIDASQSINHVYEQAKAIILSKLPSV